MTEKEKEQVAIFRFGVIFPLLETRNLRWGDKEKILKTLSEREWEIPFSNRTYISRPTILNWLSRYKNNGERIEALFPSNRSDSGRQRSISDENLAALLQLRKELPNHTIRKLIEQAYKRGIINNSDNISAPTIYRLFKQHDKSTFQKQEDMRKFEVELSNDLWQADCLHGPKVIHNNKLIKSYLFAIIDDKSRLIVGSRFYASESTDSFIHCFAEALRRRGVPRILYVDNGSSFRSHRLRLGCASLQISLRYATAYRPAGKGKIERFNKTVRLQFLPDIKDGLSLEELNTKWHNYLEKRYHITRHSSTAQSPLQRYLDDSHLLRGAPHKLPDYFRYQQERTVAQDRTVRLENRLFQVPIGFAKKRVILRYDSLDRVELFYDKKSYGFIEEVPLHANSRTRRSEAQIAKIPRSSGSLFIQEGES